MATGGGGLPSDNLKVPGENKDPKARMDPVDPFKRKPLVSRSPEGETKEGDESRRVDPWKKVATGLGVAGMPGTPEFPSLPRMSTWDTGSETGDVSEMEEGAKGLGARTKRKRISPTAVKSVGSEAMTETEDDLAESLERNLNDLRRWRQECKKKSAGTGTMEELDLIISRFANDVNRTKTNLAYMRGLVDGRDGVLKAIGEKLERLEVACTGKSEAKRDSPPAVSYAAMLRGEAVSRKNVVLVYPREVEGGEPMSSETTRKEIEELINPKDEFIQVKSMRKVRKGGIVIEAGNEKSLEKIVRNEGIINKGFVLEKPKSVKPRIMIYDMPKENEMTKKEAMEYLYFQNPAENRPEWEEFEEDFNIIRRIKSNRDNVEHWVIECSCRIRNWLRRDERLFFDWQTVKIKDYIDVVRCFRCQIYGHVVKYCKNEARCGICAERHETKNCRDYDGYGRCAACRQFNRRDDHDVNSKDCPAFQRAIEERQKKIDYGN